MRGQRWAGDDVGADAEAHRLAVAGGLAYSSSSPASSLAYDAYQARGALTRAEDQAIRPEAAGRGR